MGDNQNQSAGSARHTSRPAARIVGGGGRDTGEAKEREYLEDMREREVHPSLQYEFIRAMEEGE